MLFPIHQLPDAPAKVQIGLWAVLMGVAWLASGQLLRAWTSRRSDPGPLRAFASNRDWRWIGALLLVGGLCVARPWGMESGPFVWIRHTALLLVVLVGGELLTARQEKERVVGICLLVALLVYTGLSLRLMVRYSMPDLLGAGWLSAPWLDARLFTGLIAAGFAALLAGLWRMVRNLRTVSPLQALALVLLLPMFGEGTMLAAAMDRYSREASHALAVDGIFTEETIPAGIHEMLPPCADELPVADVSDFPDGSGEIDADHSGCHSCPMP